MNTFALGKTMVTFGIGFWLALAVFNNITDMNTNLYFVTQMITMSSIKSDPMLGKGLLWHAITSPLFPHLLMNLVICMESIAAFLLLWASVRWCRVAFGSSALRLRATSLSNIGLTIFFSIWIWFLSGDLWFGFWIKNGAFAGVHSTWIMISLLLFIFINHNPVEEITSLN